MLSTLTPQPADALLALIKLYAADPRSDKIDLGVGVYRTDTGATPVFAAIKAAEQRLVERQDSKSYLGPEGDMGFVHAMMPYVFGQQDPTMGGRIDGMQTPGGTGGVRLAVALAKRAGATVLATASSDDKLERLRDFGLDHGINYRDQDFAAVAHATQATAGWRMRINYCPRVTVAKIRISCLQRKASHGLDLVVIDYLQLIQFATRAKESRTDEALLAETTRELKILAGELMVPVILLSQFNAPQGGGDGKRPGLRRLKGSGAIGQDANAALFLHREPGQPPGPTEVVELIVEKNRNGARGAVIPLTSEKAFVRFVDRGDEAPLLDAPPTNRYGAPPARAFDPGEF